MRETLLFIKIMINRQEQIHFYLNPYIIDGHMRKHIHFYCWLKYFIYWYTSSKLIVVYISFRSYFGNIKTKLRSKCKTNLCRAHQGLLTYIYIYNTLFRFYLNFIERGFWIHNPYLQRESKYNSRIDHMCKNSHNNHTLIPKI